MVLEIILEEGDYVNFQLYELSRSKNLTWRMRRAHLIFPVIYVILSLYFLVVTDDRILGYLFLGFAVAWYFLYPKWAERRMIRHFQRHVREHQANNIGQVARIEFTDTHILTSRGESESRISVKDLKGVNETDATFYVRMNGGQALIIPKRNLSEPDRLKGLLIDLCEKQRVDFLFDESWKR